MRTIDFCKFPTPSYVVDEGRLIENLEILKKVIDRTGCKILLAQKAFSMYRTYPLIRKYLTGTTASSLFEAKLGREEMGGETHIYAPAFRESEFSEILEYTDHIVFNSLNQWKKYKNLVKECGKDISCGIRINPEYSEIETKLYDPCRAGSRMGTVIGQLMPEALKGIEGLHFHTLCEQGSDTLKRTLEKVEEKFGVYLFQMKWINFGGGHHITREDYDIEILIECIQYFQKKYNLEVYLEPGEAVALNAGYLVSEVLEIMENEGKIGILDTSAACHMPDVLEMPYRPDILGSGKPGEKAYTYSFGGPTCLAGDIIGEYSFETMLKAGDRVVFSDMAIYSMVKNNTFNGVNLPSIYLVKENGEIELVKQFGYEDFKRRL
jgi:carboxynorspermidine decarboxylase